MLDLFRVVCVRRNMDVVVLEIWTSNTWSAVNEAMEHMEGKCGMYSVEHIASGI